MALTKKGVSISIKSSLVRKSLTFLAALALIIKLCCITGLLKSKYLYFSLISSEATSLSSTSIGGTLLLFKTSNSLTKTSISPVFSFLFSISFFLFFTTPWTLIQSSLLKSSASLWQFLENLGSKTICVRPYLSLKSINITPPWSLLV